MARPPKQEASPLSREIKPPKSLVPLMEAFYAESSEAAKALIQEASKAISNPDDMSYYKETPLDDDDIASVMALMRALNPLDSLETFYSAQIVSTHMLGMRKLASPLESDQRLGLKLLKFSNDALQQLDKKRSGKGQNITVNYNYNGTGNAISQTVLKGA